MAVSCSRTSKAGNLPHPLNPVSSLPLRAFFVPASHLVRMQPKPDRTTHEESTALVRQWYGAGACQFHLHTRKVVLRK